MDFRGHLRLPDDAGTGIAVRLRIEDIFVVITSEDEELGAWRADDVVIERIFSNQFSIDLDGEPMVFVASDALGFAYEGVAAVNDLKERLSKKRKLRRKKKDARVAEQPQVDEPLEMPQPTPVPAAEHEPASPQVEPAHPAGVAFTPDERRPEPAPAPDPDESAPMPLWTPPASQPATQPIWTPPASIPPSAPAARAQPPRAPEPVAEPTLPDERVVYRPSPEPDERVARAPEPEERVAYYWPEAAQPPAESPAWNQPPFRPGHQDVEVEEAPLAFSGEFGHIAEAGEAWVEPDIEIEDYVLPAAGAADTFVPEAPGRESRRPPVEPPPSAPSPQLFPEPAPAERTPEPEPEPEPVPAASNGHRPVQEIEVVEPADAPTAGRHARTTPRKHSLFGRSRDKKVPEHEHRYGPPKTLGGLTRAVCEVCGHVTFSAEDVYQDW